MEIGAAIFFTDYSMAPADLAVINKAIFNVLKPGSIYVVLDHSAPDGSGLADTNTTHRIDEAVVKKEVEADEKAVRQMGISGVQFFS